MPTGVDTPDSVVAEFRAEYLYSGNAAGAARKVGIPERTGREIAMRLAEDSDFAADRRRLRVIELEESVIARRRVRQTALKRFLSKTGGIDVREFGGDEKSTTVITDKRHEYGKLVLDAEKNAHALQRFDAERDGLIQAPGTVNITVAPTPAAAQRIAEDEKPGDGSAGA